MPERIQKLIANAGYASRRESERLIEKGRVTLNNRPAKIGDKASLSDSITIDGKKINLHRFKEKETKVILLNKATGVVCTAKDEKNRDTVFNYLPEGHRWIMIGRLDINTSGLILFTNNGELANRLMHPSYEIEREYSARVLGEVNSDHVNQMLNGVSLDDGIAKFDRVQSGGGEGANRWYKVVIKEGRKREVRRVFEYFDLQVSRLIRIRFAGVGLKQNLKQNQVEELKPHQVNSLLTRVGLQKFKKHIQR